MIKRYREFTLQEALSDPLIQAVMAADGIDARKLERSLMTIAKRIEERPPSVAPERRPSSTRAGTIEAKPTMSPSYCC